MHPRDLRIEDFTYRLPDERIARYPLEQRDASRLLVYDNGDISEDVYANIATHIPTGSLMVFNQTKVVYARLLFRKSTGSAIEVFCLQPHGGSKDITTAMLQKGEVLWECMVGGLSKWKQNTVLQLHNDTPGFTLSATLVEKLPASCVIRLSWSSEELTFAEVLHHTGKVPLPPYINRDADIKDRDRYQTIFAADEGSVAAPTAGLHFTTAVMDSLKLKHIDTAFVTLHVGAGTFKPVKSPTMQEHDMHSEWIEVSKQTITELLQFIPKHIVTVGTTSLRTLESLYWLGAKIASGIPVDRSGIAVSQWEPYELNVSCSATEALEAVLSYMNDNGLDKLVTRTQILIAPGYTFKITSGLVTNFHQPQSTLLLLVAALIGDGWRSVYDHALAHGFRFLSYGDGCLLWKKATGTV